MRPETTTGGHDGPPVARSKSRFDLGIHLQSAKTAGTATVIAITQVAIIIAAILLQAAFEHGGATVERRALPAAGTAIAELAVELDQISMFTT